MAFEKDPNELGALWRKQGSKGEFLSGSITVGGEKVDIVCFAVKQSSDESPAYRVLRFKPREPRSNGYGNDPEF